MTTIRWPASLAIAALCSLSGSLVAGDLYSDKEAPRLDPSALPKAAEIQAVAANPAKIALKGLDDAQQIVLTATLSGGRLQDLSSVASFQAGDGKVARVTSTGRVIPVGNGETEVTVTYGDKVVKVPVCASQCDVNLPINFGNQIVPIFTKLGCNSGGCHGKASGQNGFKLSLLGFDPEVDFMSLVKEARGRRLFPASPENSLLLTKAAGIRLTAAANAWRSAPMNGSLIRRWIAAGTPFGDKTDPVVERVTVVPDHRILTRHNRQQFAVYAHYTDGSVEDITRRAQYESNDQEIAVVDANGLVSTLAMSGEAAIMVRYQAKVATFRATVPLGGRTPEYKFQPQTLVDQYTVKKWQQLGPGPVRAVQRRAVHSPGVARPDRHVADAQPGAGLRRQQGPGETRQLIDRLLDRRSTATTSPTSGPTSCASSAATSRTAPGAPSPSTTGSAGASPPTSPTTSSPATSSPPAATRSTTRPPSGTRN